MTGLQRVCGVFFGTSESSWLKQQGGLVSVDPFSTRQACNNFTFLHKRRCDAQIGLHAARAIHTMHPEVRATVPAVPFAQAGYPRAQPSARGFAAAANYPSPLRRSLLSAEKYTARGLHITWGGG